MYELRNVSKHFSTRGRMVAALQDVNLGIERGDFLAIQGPTGQGKTTLLQLLGGLDRPSSGSIFYEVQDLGVLGEGRLADLRARSFGFVFQTFNLIPTLNAQENVEAALVPLRLGTQERRSRALKALEGVGLGDRAGHLPAELSGGQQQRVAIARALVKEPQVLLADEPTGNLDEQMRDDIVALLEELWRERGLTLVIVTHDSTVARRAPRRATIEHGRLTLRAAQPTA